MGEAGLLNFPNKRQAPLLIILGTDGDANAKKDGGFRFGGNSDIYQLIPETLPFDQLNLGKQFLKRQGRPNPAHYPCVLNLVTDPDQHPETLERLRKLLRGYRGRLVNRPEVLLRTSRDQVARRLEGIEGLQVPRLLRLHNPKPGAASAAAARAGLAFPLIVRHAGTHTGKIVGVVNSAVELDAAAVGPGEFFVIAFVDFRNDDGLYRKYRLWSLGGKTIFRHMIISDNWNVHVNERTRFMLDRPELIEEEFRLLERPEGALPQSVQDTFNAVKQRMGLDFFGMDFAIGSDGKIILFEANATMNFFPLEPHLKFSYLGKIHGPAQTAFTDMLGLQERAPAPKLGT
jgi:hypothetical protein